MMKNLLLVLLLSLPMFADYLKVEDGFVKAHAEDMISNIDPIHKDIKADITIENDITTIRGVVTLDMGLFRSDNEERDNEMYKKIFDLKNYLSSNYTIRSVTKINGDNSYRLNGELSFHGVKKELSFNATIMQVNSKITIKAQSSINLSDFEIEVPCLVFICVRDKVDLDVELILSNAYQN